MYRLTFAAARLGGAAGRWVGAQTAFWPPKRALTAIAVIAIALAVTPATQPTADAASCGSFQGRAYGSYVLLSEIRTGNLSCAEGRSLAKRYASLFRCYNYGCRLRGFRCVRHRLGYESYNAHCRRGRQTARFDYGA